SEREHEPTRLDCLVGRRTGEAASAPDRERVEHGAKVATVGGELVEHGRRWCGYTGSLDDPVGLELAQASGEHVGADARQALDQVGLTARTEQQLSHDEQRP